MCLIKSLTHRVIIFFTVFSKHSAVVLEKCSDNIRTSLAGFYSIVKIYDVRIYISEYGALRPDVEAYDP